VLLLFEFLAERAEFLLRNDVITTVTLADVRWTCSLLSRLTDGKWRGAFRAGGYDAEQAARYVTKTKSQIARRLEADAG
jgi:hypothetical protein